ncbi:MAG TPA: sigma-70 family RNA polymerase sigma factor [Pseudonocardiaceae bacterium]|nr:sigma-70 family RNA polymerase sigma factor [Pseudonocardiaceae bacterium]
MRDDPTVVALVDRARDGDQAAWDEIVERYAPLVWSVCQRYRLSPADADDVAAIVWLRLVERLDSIREQAALPGWLATITRRECLNLLRIRDRYTEFDDNQHDDTAPASDHRLLAQERHIALRAAFAELSEQCQQLLTLLFHDPPTPYATISATMGLPVGGIGPRRQRCLDKLRTSAPMAAHLDNATEGR